MKRILLSLLTLLTLALPGISAESLFRNGDVFEMRLSGPPEEFTREFSLVLTVDEGSVTVPLIGRVAAIGMSSTALAASIERQLKAAKIFTIANVPAGVGIAKEPDVDPSQHYLALVAGHASRNIGEDVLSRT